MVKLGLLVGQQAVSIDRPSSEASSISPLEAEEETLKISKIKDWVLGFSPTGVSIDSQLIRTDA